MLEAFDQVDKDLFINAERLDLQNKYVLVDFWTYSSVRCIQAIPKITELYRKLSHNEFTVIGVHTPEFDFGKIPSNVSNAIKNLQITYPVVLDNEFYLWGYFNNQYWPSRYLFNKEGELIYESIGEEGIDDLVKVLKEIFNEELPTEKLLEVSREVNIPDLYLGKNRGEIGNALVHRNDSHDLFILTEKIEYGIVYLEGFWEQHGQFIESLSNESRIHLTIDCSNINGVFDSYSNVNVEISINGKNGLVNINGPDAYQISQTTYAEKNLVMTVPKGVRVYALSFY